MGKNKLKFLQTMAATMHANFVCESHLCKVCTEAALPWPLPGGDPGAVYRAAQAAWLETVGGDYVACRSLLTPVEYQEAVRTLIHKLRSHHQKWTSGGGLFKSVFGKDNDQQQSSPAQPPPKRWLQRQQPSGLDVGVERREACFAIQARSDCPATAFPTLVPRSS